MVLASAKLTQGTVCCRRSERLLHFYAVSKAFWVITLLCNFWDVQGCCYSPVNEVTTSCKFYV